MTVSGGSGTVTGVTASSPLSSSGGATPNISVFQYTGTGSAVFNQSPTMTSITVNTALSISEGILSDSTIVEADLKIVDAAVDEDIFTYESTTGDFEWHSGAELCTAITGGSGLCDGIDDTSAGGGLATTDIDASIELRNIIVDETGTGVAVFSNAPTMTGVTINDLVASRFVTTNGSKVLTTSGSSSALISTVTDETGTGMAVFNNSPTMTSVTVVTSISQDGDVADSGYLRMNNASIIAWEASPAGADVTMSADASEIIQITGGTLDGGDLTSGSVTATQLGTDSVSADELNATGVEAELEAALDIGGEVTSTGMASTVIADSVTVTGWVMGASTATTPAEDDNDTSLATTAYVQAEIMTNYYLNLLPQGAVLDDASPPDITVQESTGTGTSRRYVADFDAATDEIVYWSFVLPADYSAGSLVLLVNWFTNDTGANEDAIWAAQITCTTEADADSMAEDIAGTFNSGSENCNATEANRLIQTTITLSNTDSAAAGDFCTLRLWRDADDSSGDADNDGLTSDARLLGVRLAIPQS